MRWPHVDKEESTHWLIFPLASAFVIHFATSSLFSFVLFLRVPQKIWEARSKKQRSSDSKSSGFCQFQSVVYLITRLSKIVLVDWFWITFFLSQFWIQTHEIFLRIPAIKRMHVLTTRQWIHHSMRKFWITCLEWLES